MARRSTRFLAQALLLPLVLLASSLTNGYAAAAAPPAQSHAKYRTAHGHVQVHGHQIASLVSPNGARTSRPAGPHNKLAPTESIAGAPPGTPGPAKARGALAAPSGQAPSVQAPSPQAPTRQAPVVGGTFNDFTEGVDSNLIPPDSAIAAGPFQVVVIVNSVLKIFNKDGTLASFPLNGKQVTSAQLSQFFSPIPAAADGIFDPRAFFDPGLDRFWIFTTSENDSAFPGDTNRSTHLVALSNSDDATQGWSVFGIDATLEGNTANTKWCDYPMLGVDADSIFLSCNMFEFPSTSNNFQYAKVRVLGKSQFVNNACCSWTDFFDLREGFLNTAHSFTVQPAHEYSASSADGEWMVDAHRICILCTAHTLEVWHFANGNLDSNDIDVGNYPDPVQARQPGGPNNVDTGDVRLQFAFWKDGHLSTGQNLACPNSGNCVAYTELDVSGGLGNLGVVNDFFVGDDGQDRYYPAVDVDAAGDKSMVYSISGPSTFIGTDSIGIPRSSTCTNCLNGPETNLAGGSADYQQFDCVPGSSGCNPRNRWGDYSSAAADPDGTGVWVHGEFSGPSASPSGTWQTVVGLTNEGQDKTPPVTTAVVAPTPVSGWNKSGVIVTLNATDSQSGVRSITYSITGAENVPATTVFNSVAFIGVQNEGVSTIQFQATDNWGNQEAPKFQAVQIDETPPVVSCSAPDSAWHATDQTSSCTAFDALSGLANPGDASFTLTTSVPAGTETASAFTNTHSVCDVAGNCTTAGPVGPFMVDKKPPVISITSPTTSIYTLHQVVAASYSCTDGGSGVASCAGPVPSGGSIDTSTVGSHSFTVNAVDNVGNKSTLTVQYIVAYAVCLQYDPTIAHPASAYSFPIELCDANGVGVSSSSVTVHATLITPGSITPTSSAQPTNDFVFDPTIGTSGGYVYVLNTKNLPPNSYQLQVTATGDPTVHELPFKIK